MPKKPRNPYKKTKLIWPDDYDHIRHIYKVSEEENLSYSVFINERGRLEFFFRYMHPTENDKIKRLWLEFHYGVEIHNFLIRPPINPARLHYFFIWFEKHEISYTLSVNEPGRLELYCDQIRLDLL